MRFSGLNVVLMLLFAAIPAIVPASHRPVASDNSRQNAAIRHDITAEAQPNDRADCLTAASVRRVIVADDSLSVYGHNVKIIVAQGNVTLEGPVHSIDERQEIALDAATVVDLSHITNRITIA